MGLDYCLLFGEQYTYAYNLAEERFSADGTYAGAGSETTNDEDRRELEMGVDDAAQVRLFGCCRALTWWSKMRLFFFFLACENTNHSFSFSFAFNLCRAATLSAMSRDEMSLLWTM